MFLNHSLHTDSARQLLVVIVHCLFVLVGFLDVLDRAGLNLIRFHQIPDIPLQGVDDEKMEQFRDYLTQHGVFTTIRASRGQDIYAACGLLSTSKKIGEIREHEDEEKMNK